MNSNLSICFLLSCKRIVVLCTVSLYMFIDVVFILPYLLNFIRSSSLQVAKEDPQCSPEAF